MASRQAAAKGHGLYHGGVLDTGSHNVIAHNEPVWRSQVDEHNCEGGPPPTVPPGAKSPGETAIRCDGPEMMLEGAERVLVNNERLGRAGDFLLGAGAPNMIAPKPNFRVLVGENNIGSDTDEFQKLYCEEFCALKKDWPKMSPEQREAAWKDMVRRLFKAQGLPAPSFDYDSGNTNGSMNRNMRFGINPTFFKDANLGGLSKTTWHELRHGEQFFHGLRYALGAVRRGEASAAQILLIGTTSPRVLDKALKAGTLDSSTPLGRWAAQNSDALWSWSGMRQLGWVNGDYHKRYATTPAGADVRVRVAKDDMTGRANQCKCGP